jgi:ABC-2 type transport system ATP-binding protein
MNGCGEPGKIKTGERAMSDILKVKHLSKSFGKNRVLQDFSMTLEKGRIYGLLGKNGEGKTTLIRMIMGIIPADSGEIFFKGKKIGYLDAAYKRDIGYIPEDAFFYSWMRIADLLEFNASFYPGWDAKKAGEYLERFSLARRSRIGKLSRGMKLKLGLVVALAAKPELLILDDPTSGIDVPTRQDFLRNIIKELSDAGTTILFSTHLIHELERIIDDLGILHQGRLILEKEYEKVKNSVRRIRLTFENSAPEKLDFPGILKAKKENASWEGVIYPWDEGSEAKARSISGARIEVEPLTLEEVFMSFVSEDKSWV